MFSEERKRAQINKNIATINNYLIVLPEEALVRFYAKLDDILYFYGFDRATVRKIIENQGFRNTVSINKLAELEGVTNAMLFHLKYKMESIPEPVKRKTIS